MALCTEQGFPFFLAGGTILQGWALAKQGQWEEGITQMHQGLAAYRATGVELTKAVIVLPGWPRRMGNRADRGRAERAGRGAGFRGQEWEADNTKRSCIGCAAS